MYIRPVTERGLTLVETLIAASLALLVLGLVTQLMVNSFRISGKGAVRVDLQQRAMTLTSKLERDLRQSPSGALGFRFDSTPALLSIHPRRNDTGTVAWLGEVYLYSWSDNVLRRLQVPIDPAPTRAFRPATASEWSTLLSTAGRESLRFAHVTLFQASLEENVRVRFRVDFEKSGQKLTSERLIFLRQGS